MNSKLWIALYAYLVVIVVQSAVIWSAHAFLKVRMESWTLFRWFLFVSLFHSLLVYIYLT